ncbi:hypothetical protein [Bradyrhizobium sp. STM 3561]|uniref:hypothetical protein n=1 Tax=Bradyrhizobium sp. STM 3561 TaxID=578923 RepID=UPI00389089B4
MTIERRLRTILPFFTGLIARRLSLELALYSSSVLALADAVAGVATQAVYFASERLALYFSYPQAAHRGSMSA